MSASSVAAPIAISGLLSTGAVSSFSRSEPPTSVCLRETGFAEVGAATGRKLGSSLSALTGGFAGEDRRVSGIGAVSSLLADGVPCAGVTRRGSPPTEITGCAGAMSRPLEETALSPIGTTALRSAAAVASASAAVGRLIAAGLGGGESRGWVRGRSRRAVLTRGRADGDAEVCGSVAAAVFC